MDVALARPAEVVPPQDACAGGCRYELKFDGYRMVVVVVVVVRSANGARLWSRRGTDLTSAFRDLAAAAEFHLREGTVLDGEAVVWADGRLSFDQLQQRLARRNSRVDMEGPPASYVAFDVLALDAQDQRGFTYAARRRRLERLAVGWGPPLEICPSTADRDEAMAWYEDYRPAGIEGLVVKSANGRYLIGRRDWIKVNSIGLMILRALAIPCVARLSECLPVRDTCCAQALAEGIDRWLFCFDGVCHRRDREGSND